MARLFSFSSLFSIDKIEKMKKKILNKFSSFVLSGLGEPKNTERRMKKFSLTAIPLLCAVAAPLCADNMGNNKSQQQQQMMSNDITPMSEPVVKNWCDPFVTVDFTWWKALEDGLDYAFTSASAETQGNASSGDYYHPNFNFKPGFKVGFGLKFRRDGWDLYSQYTYFRNTNSKGHTPGSAPGAIVNANLNTIAVDGSVEQTALSYVAGVSANTSWSLKFNALNLELGRGFYISQWLTLRPHFGMKFSWIKQNWNVNYGTGYSIANSMTQSASGLRAGLDAHFMLHKYWSIYGQMALSALWNDFDVSRSDFTTTDGGYTALNTSRNIHRVTEVLEMGLGLEFDYPFSNDQYMWFLSAGWEEQIWFGQNQFIKLLVSDRNDLMFQGLTIETGLYF